MNKGDDSNYNIRARVVGKEFKASNPMMEGTFAATPPLEALRFCLSRMMTKKMNLKGETRRFNMMVLDVSRARFHAPAIRELHIDLPEGDREEGMVGKLLRTLYGTRDAAAQWEKYYTDKMEEANFVAGKAIPCVFEGPDDSCAMVHGDDMVFVGERELLEVTQKKLEKSMLIKRQAMLGLEEGDQQHVRILNRLISYKKGEITYEPDPRHVSIALRDLGLEENSENKVKGVSTPGIKDDSYYDDGLLEGERRRIYRSVCMRFAYVAQDWPHIQFAVHKACRHMANPTVGGWNRLKRVRRFLKQHGRWIQIFRQQDSPKAVVVKVDADFAGDLLDRKSVSSVLVFHGSHLVKASSTTQTVPALSSADRSSRP